VNLRWNAEQGTEHAVAAADAVAAAKSACHELQIPYTRSITARQTSLSHNYDNSIKPATAVAAFVTKRARQKDGDKRTEKHSLLEYHSLLHLHTATRKILKTFSEQKTCSLPIAIAPTPKVD
jgi:hypothetical protein